MTARVLAVMLFTEQESITDMHDFYTHVMRELPAIIDRWRESRGRDR